jgi:SAM-dependent methyltransferase
MPFDASEEWRRIARGPDVLYHVLGWPGMENSWTEEAFYATGRSDWADFRRQWRHYEPGLGGTCVEIGSGAGRLTAALAEDFERVVALDVSEEMLARTAAAAGPAVEPLQVDGQAIPLVDGEADAVFSCHVLQHLDGARELATYMAEARRVLRPGGTLMAHIWLTSSPPAGPRRWRQELRLRLARRGLRRGRRPTAVRMRTYRAEYVQAMLGEAGFVEIELRMFAVRSNGFHHHFWLARAPEGELSASP